MVAGLSLELPEFGSGCHTSRMINGTSAEDRRPGYDDRNLLSSSASSQLKIATMRRLSYTTSLLLSESHYESNLLVDWRLRGHLFRLWEVRFGSPSCVVRWCLFFRKLHPGRFDDGSTPMFYVGCDSTSIPQDSICCL